MCKAMESFSARRCELGSVVLHHSGIVRLVNGSFRKPFLRHLTGAAAFRIYEDAQGNLWANKGTALFRASEKGVEVLVLGCTEVHVPGYEWRSVGGHRERGTDSLRRPHLQMYPPADGLSASNIPMAVLAAHDGTLWVAATAGAFRVLTAMASRSIVRGMGS